MVAKTVLRWLLPKSDPPMVTRVSVETEEQLARRNREKLEQAKRALGGRYVLHSSNAVTRQERPRTVAAGVRRPTQGISRGAPAPSVVRGSS